MIFGTVFGQSRTDFQTLCVCVCVCFFFFFLCYCKKFEQHVGCVKIMLMHAYGCIDMKFMMDVNYM